MRKSTRSILECWLLRGIVVAVVGLCAFALDLVAIEKFRRYTPSRRVDVESDEPVGDAPFLPWLEGGTSPVGDLLQPVSSPAATHVTPIPDTR